MKNSRKSLVDKPEKVTNYKKDSTDMNLTETECDVMEWINLAQDRNAL